MFNNQLLTSYMETFFGYGNLDGSIWFIGMEEGGGNNIDEIRQRLTVWDQFGQPTLEDLYAYHQAIGVTGWFGDSPKLQPTWNRLSRVAFAVEGKQNITTDDARHYQANRLGRHTENTALIELMPLPSPSTDHWLYGEHITLESLQSRSTYYDVWRPQRIEAIRQLIRRYAPQLVMFYSMQNREWWASIAGQAFELIEDGDYYRARSEGTTFIVTRHPVAFGTTLAYFQHVATLI